MNKVNGPSEIASQWVLLRNMEVHEAAVPVNRTSARTVLSPRSLDEKASSRTSRACSSPAIDCERSACLPLKAKRAMGLHSSNSIENFETREFQGNIRNE